MTRTAKDRGRHAKCPEGRQCDWCGPRVAAEHRAAKARDVDDGLEEWRDQDPVQACGDATCPECADRVKSGVEALQLLARLGR